MTGSVEFGKVAVVEDGASGATQWLDGFHRDPVVSLERSEGAHLLIVAPDGTWTSRPLMAGGGLTIGRGDEADVRIEERAASRLHARLEMTSAGKLQIIDLGSTNGTRIGGELVRNEVVSVQPGEAIWIGRTVVTVLVSAAMDGAAMDGAAMDGAAMDGAAMDGAAMDGAATVGGTTRAARLQLVPERVRGEAMEAVDELIAKAAPTMISVLLLGETGAGKDVVAERLHRLSTRAAGPLVRLNCAGLSAALLESELFGHERGAFTGAAQTKPGLLEAAAGGTVFLDEIGEMPMEVQAKLLLAIEQRVARRVGGTRSEPIDVRFISATHRDLEAEIRRDRFRADFYYRINGLTIRILPLRERRDEIDHLIAQFAEEAAARLGLGRAPIFDDEARERIHRHDWPGNIRELRSVVERAVLLTDTDTVTSRVLTTAGLRVDAPLLRPGMSDEEVERDRVISTLAEFGGNQSRAARALGISRNTLIARIRQYGLVRPQRQHGLP